MGLAQILDYIGEQNALSGAQKWAQENFADNPTLISLAQNDPRAFRSMMPELIQQQQMKSALASLTGGQKQNIPMGSFGDMAPEMGVPQTLPTAQPQQSALSQVSQGLDPDRISTLARINPNLALKYVLDQTNPETQLGIKKTQLEIDRLQNPEKYSAEAIKSKKEMAPSIQVFSDTIESIRSDLDALNEMRAIPSTERSPLSNTLSYIANTEYAGDPVGRMMGTKAQTISDTIQSKIPVIKQVFIGITGMSAKQMDSNKEMENFQKTFGSQTSTYEARKAALDNLMDFANTYAENRLGKSISPKKEQKTPTSSLASVSQGQIYVNPKTGERIKKVNGKWVSVQ